MTASVQKGKDWVPSRLLAGTSATSWFGKGGVLIVEGVTQAELDAAVAAYDAAAARVQEQAEQELKAAPTRDAIDGLDDLVETLIAKGVITANDLPATSRGKNAARKAARAKL